MTVIADKGRMLNFERNVGIPDLDRPASAYDLGLYMELGSQSRAVLVVTPICRLSFKNGAAANLTWSPAERKSFTDGLRALLVGAWSERHVLKTAGSTALTYDVISVVFDVQLSESLGRTDHSHWNVAVTKLAAGGFNVSETGDPIAAGLLNGSVDLDSEDLTPVNKGGPQTQRAAAHEFGHMMGYLDEYKSADGSTPGVSGWTDDKASIMNLGETVQPRHYVWFAEWCNDRHRALASLSRQPIEWKVNGVTTKANAGV